MSYKIVIKRTCIIINNYNMGDCIKLENSFKVWDQALFTSFYKQIEYDEKTKTLIIPRGVDISYIESLFDVKAYTDYTHDEYRSNSTSTLLRYPPRNEKQIETINFLLGQGKYEYTSYYNQLFVALNTGVGKTYLGIAYMAYMNMKSVVITSSVHWLEQWKNRIIEHTNILSKEICFIHGSPTINSLLRKTTEEVDKNKIYLVTHATLLSLANNNGWDAISELFRHLGIGIKIFDEAHLNFANISYIDFHTNTYKTLYLSATPGRGDSRENEIFNLYFKNVPMITLFDPEEDPRTNYIAIRYRSGLTAQELSKCIIRNRGFNKMIYCDQVILKENFDYLMRVLMDILSNIRGKKLIFLSTNNAVKILYEWIECNYPEYHNCVGIYTSLNPNKMSALDNHIILTTSKSAGEALDIKGLACSVQLLEPTKSELQNRQRLGRTRGRNTVYIDIVDDDCAVSKKYYIGNLPLFEKYALSTKEIRFTNKDLKNQAFNIMDKRMTQGISPFIKL